MKIRYTLERPLVPGINYQAEFLVVEFDIEVQSLEQTLKKLPQTPLVKSWSAALALEASKKHSPDSSVQEVSAVVPHSSQSSASDKADESISPSQVVESLECVGHQASPQALAPLREIHSYITSLLESTGSEA